MKDEFLQFGLCHRPASLAFHAALAAGDCPLPTLGASAIGSLPRIGRELGERPLFARGEDSAS